jgi:signal peptidase
VNPHATPRAVIAATTTAPVSLPTPSSALRRRIGLGLTIVAIGLAASMLIPLVLGYQRYVITSGSMTGTYNRGTLIYDDTVPTSSLKVGDIITYTPPPGVTQPGRLTHRIYSITVGKDGERTYRTKGDANPVADPWTFQLAKTTQARVAFGIPYLGFVFAALSIPFVRILLIGLPALLIALGAAASLWQEAGREKRR